MGTINSKCHVLSDATCSIWMAHLDSLQSHYYMFKYYIYFSSGSNICPRSRSLSQYHDINNVSHVGQVPWHVYGGVGLGLLVQVQSKAGPDRRSRSKSSQDVDCGPGPDWVDLGWLAWPFCKEYSLLIINFSVTYYTMIQARISKSSWSLWLIVTHVTSLSNWWATHNQVSTYLF